MNYYPDGNDCLLEVFTAFCLFSSVYQESGEWAEDQTSRASPGLSIRAGRVKGDLETRGQTGDLPASAASKSLLRTSLREVESSLQTSEWLL